MVKFGRRTGPLLLALVWILALAACSQEPAVDAKLLEPQGLHWNASAEEVLEALGITEAVSDEEIVREDGGRDRVIRAGGVSFFGNTGDAELIFTQNSSASDQPAGLCRITLSFPDGTDMRAVLKQMTQLYGDGSQLQPDDYVIDVNGQVSRMPSGQRGTFTVPQPDGTSRTYLLEPSEHKIYWAARGNALLAEDTTAGAVSGLAERGIASEPAAELLDKMILVSLSWSEGNVLEDGTVEPHNQVRFDGRGLVFALQTALESST